MGWWETAWAEAVRRCGVSQGAEGSLSCLICCCRISRWDNAVLFGLLGERGRRKAVKRALRYSTPACCVIEGGENLVSLFINPFSCLMPLNPIISTL